MQEKLKQQHIPVKVYRTDERLMIAAPMAGLEPENIVGGLSPRVSTPSPGQCHVCQRHLWQWRADGDLADQPTDAPCTTDARTTRPYSRRAQRQCRAPSLMRSAMMARATQSHGGPAGQL